MTLNDLKVNTVLFNEEIQIAQCNNHFKYSIDSLILSSFVNTSKAKSILDVGTNNAIIPVMIARNTKASITGVEINDEAIPYALETLKLNKLETQINIINNNYIDFCASIKPKKYDIIISNPPYFEESKSRLVKENDNLARARHDNDLSLDDLIKHSRTIIENNGLLYLVLRPERLVETINKLTSYSFEPKRLLLCYPKVNKQSNLFVIEAKFMGNPGLKIEEPLIVHNDDGSYSKQLEDYIGGK